MKTIAFFTTARSEFGILSALIKKIAKSQQLDYRLFVGGMHLAPEFGLTIREVQDKEINISDTFDFLLNGDQPLTLAKSAGIATYEVARIFSEYQFDMVCVLGDRFELLSIVTTALLFNKPIIHIHGGETTTGAVDNQVRNMITKAAHLHFVSCEEYAQNVRNMGEEPDRIYNTGALAIDNIKNLKPIDKTLLFTQLNLDLNKPTVLITYHPVTLEIDIPPLQQIKNLLEALKKFEFQIVFTAPNMDADHQLIVDAIKDEVKRHENYHYVESLGMRRYFSLLAHCKMVIGNSSSGLIEVPYFKIPTVNIGDRQKGRVRHDSVIDVGYSVKSIEQGITTALSEDFLKKIRDMKFKFGDGRAADRMIEILKHVHLDKNFLQKR